MVDIGFMSGFAILVSLRYLFTFFAVALVALFVYKGYNAYVEERVTPKFILSSVLTATALILVGMFLFGGVAAPRGELDIPYKARPLQENIEIVTPPPRTETLDGFVPMKVDN